MEGEEAPKRVMAGKPSPCYEFCTMTQQEADSFAQGRGWKAFQKQLMAGNHASLADRRHTSGYRLCSALFKQARDHRNA